MDALVGQPRKLNVRSFHKNLFNHYRNFWNYHNYCFISTRTIKVCFETCFMCIPFQRASQGARINIMWFDNWRIQLFFYYCFVGKSGGFGFCIVKRSWLEPETRRGKVEPWTQCKKKGKWNRGHNVKKLHFSFCGQRKFCEVIWGLIFVFCCFLSFNIMTPPLS